MRRSYRLPLCCGGLCSAMIVLSGCVLAPAGFKDEQRRLGAVAAPFERPPADRVVPDLSPEPDWRELLRHAFLANGRLEAAYFEWKAALARVQVVAAYPNTNIALGFNFLFSPSGMKAWDRTTLNAGFDPMQNLSFPTKVLAAGRVALDDARAAAQRFEQVKFRLQREVLTAYLDYALLAEKIRLQEAQLALLDLQVSAEATRIAGGGRQQVLRQAGLDRDLAANRLANLGAEAVHTRARLNRTIGREPGISLLLPPSLPPPREIAANDAEVVALVAQRNPDVAELAAQVAMRGDALDLARQQYIPDINPFITLTGGIERAAGAMLSLPATIPKIRAMVEDARAMLHGAEASHRQAALDTVGSLVRAMTGLHNAERQVAVFTDAVLPAAEGIATNRRDAYRAGDDEFAAAIEAERAVIDARLMLAELLIAREQFLAEIEELAAIDIEVLGSASSNQVVTNTPEALP